MASKKSVRSEQASSVAANGDEATTVNWTLESAYAAILPEAMALQEHEIMIPRADFALLSHNFRTTAEVVDSAWDEVVVWIAKPDRSVITNAKVLSLALEKAVQDCVELASEGVIQKKLSRAMELRSLLFAGADFGVALGLLDGAKVAYLHTGRGPRDAVEDLSALAPMFTAEVRARIPAIEEATVEEAKVLAAELLLEIKPDAAKAKKKGPAPAIEVRNRIFTLVSRSYDLLWRYGAVVWGRAVDQRLPALHGNRKAAPAPKAPPVG